MTFTLSSTAFRHDSLIPDVYTCDGKDISPQLKWEGAPSKTQSFTLIMDDPDAPMGTWDHWIVFNIPAETKEFSENIKSLPSGTKVGTNSWGRSDYGGPCPPDREHRYDFKLFALDKTLDLPTGASKHDVLKAMKGHVLGETELMGRYDRPQNKK